MALFTVDRISAGIPRQPLFSVILWWHIYLSTYVCLQN